LLFLGLLYNWLVNPTRVALLRSAETEYGVQQRVELEKP